MQGERYGSLTLPSLNAFFQILATTSDGISRQNLTLMGRLSIKASQYTETRVHRSACLCATTSREIHNFFVTFIEVLKDRETDSMEVEKDVTSGDFLQGFYLGHVMRYTRKVDNHHDYNSTSYPRVGWTANRFV